MPHTARKKCHRRMHQDLKAREDTIISMSTTLTRVMRGKRESDLEDAYWFARFLACIAKPLIIAQEVGKGDFQKAGWWMEGGEA